MLFFAEMASTTNFIHSSEVFKIRWLLSHKDLHIFQINVCSWLQGPTELIGSAGTADGSCFGYSVDMKLPWKNTFYVGLVSATQALTPSNSHIRSNIAPSTFTIICPKPFSCYIESTYVILIHQIMQCWQIDHIIFISLIFDSWMIFFPILVINVCAFADAT